MTIHHELELKAVVPDPDAFRRRMRATGAVPRFIGRMTDLRYDRAAELALRDEVLRVRTLHHPDGRIEAVVAWKGPTMRSPDGYKLREEIELPMADTASHPGRLLLALGYRPVHLIERAVAASGIPRAEFTAEPLAEFTRRFEQRSGQPALLATSALGAMGHGE